MGKKEKTFTEYLCAEERAIKKQVIERVVAEEPIIKKEIKRLKESIDVNKLNQESLIVANALMKQVAVEVMSVVTEVGEEIVRYHKCKQCGRCGCLVREYYNYCAICGQRLSWDKKIVVRNFFEEDDE